LAGNGNGNDNDNVDVETDESSRSSESATDRVNTYRERLITFYKVHNPEKIKNVDKLLGKFKGREAELFTRIEEIYSVKPLLPGTTASNSQLTSPPTVPLPEDGDAEKVEPSKNKNTPGKFKDMDKLLQRYKGGLGDFSKSIKNKLNMIPTKLSLEGRGSQETNKKEEIYVDPEDTEIYRESLSAFYKEYKPEKIGDVDYLLEFYHGKEEVLFGRIETAYQINPFRPALVAFYTAHNPEKLKNVDTILEKFKGKETEIFKHIKATYSVGIASNETSVNAGENLNSSPAEITES